MKDKLNYYITTAIDYPNARPHIGTAFEKIGADVQARFQRFIGRNVFFLMGNDENTIKVVHRAADLDEPVKAYVDRMAEDFKAVWKALDISYDDFIQTSEERHKRGVQHFLQTVYDAGFIYKKPYQGFYCEGCEEFKLEKNLKNIDGMKVCPNHPLTPIQYHEEENYFFKLSAFKRWILDLYVPAFDTAYMEILPDSRLHEMENFVNGELDDISISRKNEGWGIPIPWDESQVAYVWFDALLNYLTGIGFGSPSPENAAEFLGFWPADVHVIGKDITRFHCALWPAMIAAYNKKAEHKISYPEKVFAHGFIYQKKDGADVKIGKTTGAYIDPAELVLKYGSDAYRYYFLAKCSFGSDGEYSLAHFHEVYNSELANNLGNLASRVGNMILKNFEGRVPNMTFMFRQNNPLEYIGDSQFELMIDANTFAEKDALAWAKALQDFDYRKGLHQIWETLIFANKYLDDTKPWMLVKTDKSRCSVVLRNAVILLRLVAVLLKPYLPKASKALYNTYIFPVKWEDVDWKYLLEIAKHNDVGLDQPFTLNPDALVKDEKNKVALEGTADVIHFRKYPGLFPRLET